VRDGTARVGSRCRQWKENGSMGFMSGVVTGVALAAGAAAWYMSRSGERFRDQYRVDRKLGELGDQLEARTREIRESVNSQINELRAEGTDAVANADAKLDDAQASAAEAAAELAAEVEAKAAKVKKQAKDAAPE
jgi:gas vesicle protein